MIVVSNHGPLIVSSNYWGSEIEQAGKLFVSVNAGAVRVLLPAAMRGVVEEIRAARYAILSRGPWPAAGIEEAVEILWEDGSDAPFAWQLSASSFDLLPAEPPPDRGWTISIWTLKKGKAHRILERACHWRRVPVIPYLRPLGE